MTQQYSDAVRRIVDTYSLHRLADPLGNIGQWFAVALADGRSDGHLYHSKQACIRAQRSSEYFYMYVQVVPGDMDVKAAETLLGLHRRMYEKGVRIADRDHPSGGREMIQRATVEDMRNQIRAMFGRGRPTNIRRGQ